MLIHFIYVLIERMSKRLYVTFLYYSRVRRAPEMLWRSCSTCCSRNTARIHYYYTHKLVSLLMHGLYLYTTYCLKLLYIYF